MLESFSSQLLGRFGGGSASSSISLLELLAGRLRVTSLDKFIQWEELFVGAMLQFPLYFIVGWWVVPIGVVCGVLWRLGGWTHGWKGYRRIGVPLLVCISTMIHTNHWAIFLCMPFLVWLAPSYGKESWLFKLLKNDFLTRLVCFAWYWLTFSIAYRL